MLLSHLFSLSTLLAFASSSITAAPAPAPTSGDQLPNRVEQLSQDAFGESLWVALAQPDASLKLLFLMHKYSLEVSPKNPTYKYHCAFLARATLDAFVSALDQTGGVEGLFLHQLDLFAAKVYENMARTSPEQAQRALQRINRTRYNSSIDKDYSRVINAYVEDGTGPACLKATEDLVSKAFADPQISVQLSDQQKEVLQKLQGGSLTYRPLLCYAFKHYRFRLDEDQKQFQWRSLVFSLMHSFALEFPDLLTEEVTGLSIVPFDSFSEELSQKNPIFSQGLEKLDPSSQGLPQKTPIFSEGLENAAASEGYIESAAAWGHIHTVKLFLNDPRVDFSYAGRALEVAARNGQKDIVELLLEKRPDIPADYVGKALQSAAFYGYKDTVEPLLKAPIIPTYNARRALRNAAKNGHNDTVKLLLSAPIVTIRSVCEAFEDAVSEYRMNTVKLLLSDLRIDHITICDAFAEEISKNHKDTVELLLTDPRVTAIKVCDALRHSTWHGRKEIVELLINDPRMTASCAREASSIAYRWNQKEILNLIKARMSSLPEEESCIIC